MVEVGSIQRGSVRTSWVEATQVIFMSSHFDSTSSRINLNPSRVKLVWIYVQPSWPRSTSYWVQLSLSWTQ